jgi:hypothetical protein
VLSPPPSRAEALSATLASLPGLSLDELRALWVRTYARPAPRAFKSDLLARALAQVLQVQAHGDVGRDTARLLNRLASGADAAAVLSGQRQRRLKPGTVLVREHAGTLHHVMVLPDGYAWNGATHSSLSEVARAITGTRWNGWTFFGLQPKRATQPQARRTAPPLPGRPQHGRPSRLGTEPASSTASQGALP